MADSLNPFRELVGVPTKLLAKPYRRGIHQVGPARLHDMIERLGLR